MNLAHVLTLIPFEWERFVRQYGFVLTRIGFILTPLALILAWGGTQMQVAAATGNQSAAQAFGSICLTAAYYLIGGIACFTMPKYAGAVFVRERQHGVLPLLLLTRTSPLELLVVKAFPPLVFGVLMLLSQLPFVVWAIYYLQLPWHFALYLFALAMLYITGACMLGVMVSTWSKSGNGGVMLGQALMLTITLVAIVPSSFGFLLGNGAFYSATSLSYRVALFVIVLGATLALAIVCLAIGAAVIGREGYARKGVVEPKRRAAKRAARRVNGHPVARLAYAISGAFGFAGRNWPIKLIAFTGLIIAGAIPMIGPVLVVATLQREASLSLKRTRELGVLDDLAMTPHTNAQLGFGFLRGQFRAGVPYIVAALLGCALMYAASFMIDGGMELDRLIDYHVFVIPVFLSFYVIALTFATLESTVDRVGILLRIALPIGFVLYVAPMIVLFVTAMSGSAIRYFLEDAARAIGIESAALNDGLSQTTVWLLVQGPVWTATAAILLIAAPRIGRNIRHAHGTRPRATTPTRTVITHGESVA